MAMGLVAGEDFVTVVYAALEPVTLTEIVFPTCAVVSFRVVPVAPEIALPDANHWYLRTVPEVQVPGFAVSVWPLLPVPLIVGDPVVSTPTASFAVATEVLLAVV